MKRLLIAALAAFVPAVANAGVGLTWFTGSEFGAKSYYASPMGLPTIDIHNKEFVVQLHALDLVHGIVNEQLYLGANGYMTTRRMKVNEDIGGVIAPGASLDIVTNFDFDPLNLAAQGLVRMGAQTQKGMGFGIYVVPGLGIAMAGGEFDVVMSGQLQISTWTNK